MINGFLINVRMTKYSRISSHTRKPFLKYDFAPIPYEFPYTRGKFPPSFFLSVCKTPILRASLIFIALSDIYMTVNILFAHGKQLYIKVQ